MTNHMIMINQQTETIRLGLDLFSTSHESPSSQEPRKEVPRLFQRIVSTRLFGKNTIHEGAQNSLAKFPS
jgi:hypothetical protein